MANSLAREQGILCFEEIVIGDVSRVGGKNASLGEMYRELTRSGVKIQLDSISLNPDAVIKTTRLVYEVENS